MLHHSLAKTTTVVSIQMAHRKHQFLDQPYKNVIQTRLKIEEIKQQYLEENKPQNKTHKQHRNKCTSNS